MNRRAFLMSASALLVVPGMGLACTRTENELCGIDVPNNEFGLGTINRPADYNIKVCLPDDIWKAIQPKDGSQAKWVFRLITFDKTGNVRWHNSKTMVGQQCRTQGVYKGTHVFVYVTCKYFTGWLTTGLVTKNGQIPLQPIPWVVTCKWLDNNFPGKL